MGMRGPEQNGLRRDASALLNGTAGRIDLVPHDEQRIQSDQGHGFGAIIEHHRPDLAGIVELGVKAFAITAGPLHSKRRRDIHLGEANLDRDREGAATPDPENHQTEPDTKRALHDFLSTRIRIR